MPFLRWLQLAEIRTCSAHFPFSLGGQCWSGKPPWSSPKYSIDHNQQSVPCLFSARHTSHLLSWIPALSTKGHNPPNPGSHHPLRWQECSLSSANPAAIFKKQSTHVLKPRASCGFTQGYPVRGKSSRNFSSVCSIAANGACANWVVCAVSNRVVEPSFPFPFVIFSSWIFFCW